MTILSKRDRIDETFVFDCPNLTTVSLNAGQIDLPDLMEAWDQFADAYFQENSDREMLKQLGREYLDKCDDRV